MATTSTSRLTRRFNDELRGRRDADLLPAHPQDLRGQRARFFIDACGASRVAAPHVWDELMAAREFAPGVRVSSGHFGGLLPFWIRQWPRTITMLREPVARALSHINHVQRHPEHRLYTVAAGLSVHQYCEHPELRKTVDNFQARYLASLSFARAVMPRRSEPLPFGELSVRFENTLFGLHRDSALAEEAIAALATMEAVGICESHRESLALLASVLQLPVSRQLPEIRTNVAVGGISLESLSDAEVECLRNLNVADQAVYDRARMLFAESCERLGLKPGLPMKP